MVRVTLLALLTLFLHACGRDADLGPFAESRVPPSISARFYPPEGWAWGFLRAGTQPVQRYGVAAPDRVPRAVVVITPGYGESAEVWFETARDLIENGYTVWILDRAGQGGSARYAAPRDAGHVTSFGPDVANLRNLVRQVVKPEPGAPVILLAYADGAVVALRALQSGLEVDGVVTISPGLAPRAEHGAGFGLFARLPRIAGGGGWSRDAPDDLALRVTHDPWRGAVRQAWQVANPDLRLAEPTAGWRSAYAAASRAVEAEASQVRAPVVMFNPAEPERALCRRMTDCAVRQVGGARRALHLEADPWRSPLTQQFTAFVEARIAARDDQARTARRR